MNVLLGAIALYYALAVFWYWRPLLAVWRTPRLPLPPNLPPDLEKPLLVAIAPCRGGAEAIPGMVDALKKQNYPANRHRTIILIDREGDADRSAEIARSAGAEVYERRDADVKTKGGAVNELLARQLVNQPWHALLVLDIDVRLDPDFFTRTAAYLNQGAQVLQCAPRSKTAGEAVGRLNHIGQLLSQLIQHGRAALGLSAILSGSCMVITRSALSRLDWQTSTGRRLSDDGELNYRCLMNDIPVTYAADLQVRNDLAADNRAVRLQRRRWFAAHLEGLPYAWPLIKKGLAGCSRALEGLFTLLFLPGSSLTFILAGAGVFFLGLWTAAGWPLGGWVAVFGALWVLHAIYYIAALRTVDGFLSWQEFKHLPGFLGARLAGIGSGILLKGRRNPGHHSVPFEASADSVAKRVGKHPKQ